MGLDMVATKKHMQDNATPLTRCNNCLTVFEVPREVLDSSDTRVRCGECLGIFDAREGLHTVEQENLADTDTRNEALAEASAASEDKVVQRATLDAEHSAELPNIAGGAKTSSQKVSSKAAMAIAAGHSGADDVSQAPQSAKSVDEHVGQVGQAPAIATDRAPQQESGDGSARPDADLDVTYSDFDLFSDEVDLPVHEFFDETRAPVNLNFDHVPADHDETFSDTLFNNDVTIDAGQGAVAAEGARNRNKHLTDPENRGDDDKSFGKGSNVEFANDGVGSTAAVEFDYSDRKDTDIVVPGEDPVFDPAESDAVAPVSTSPEAVKKSSWPLAMLLASLLGLLVLGLYGYQNRSNLADNPIARPLVQAWCMLAKCELPARLDSEQLRLISKNMYSNPDRPDALVINVVLKNTAKFDQRYPVLQVRLSDLTGTVVAERAFTANDYLKIREGAQIPTISAGSSVDISFDILDPGQNARSFVILLR